MRSWLNGDFLYELPHDLSAHMVSVQKRSANYVDSLDESDEFGTMCGSPGTWVSQTSDVLWLPSVCELCGEVTANVEMGICEDAAIAYGAEGEQYELLRTGEVLVPNKSLVRQ